MSSKQHRVDRAVALASYLDFYIKYARYQPHEAHAAALKQLKVDGYTV